MILLPAFPRQPAGAWKRLVSNHFATVGWSIPSRSAEKIRPQRGIGCRIIAGRVSDARREGPAGAVIDGSVNQPVADHSACDVVSMEKTFVLAKRQLDRIVQGEDVTLVAVIDGTFGAQIKRILDHAGTAAAGKTGDVVDHFGKCIGAAELDAFREAPAQLKGRAVVDGIALRRLPDV